MERVTNNDIRCLLGLSINDPEFLIKKVDAVGDNINALMFINKPDVDLEYLDTYCVHCLFLVDEDLYEINESSLESKDNDFILCSNPKYWFCVVQDHFDIPSRFQLEVPECNQITRGVDCSIYPGTIIGGVDFSPVKGTKSGELVEFPQLGGVRLGNNVVIKYNTMVGKGTFGYTSIGDNTMIDYGCQIGHNCIIGKSCIIAAGTIIGGSTIVGDNVVIGIGAKIRNGIKIGNNASVGMGAVVIRDVPDGAVVVGNPARIIDHVKIFDEKGLV